MTFQISVLILVVSDLGSHSPPLTGVADLNAEGICVKKTPEVPYKVVFT